MTATPLKIGFIGLGIMGAPMALHLIAAGHQLFVTTRSKLPEAVAATSAVRCANAAEVARQAEVVFLMVPDTPDVERVLFSEGGVAQGLVPGRTVVDMSSISPIETQAFAQKIAALGCDYVDAPVSGGEVGAKAASLTIMVGGTEAAFERVKPLFALMGKNITHVGPAGAGQTTKVANQIIVALNIEAVGEALAIAPPTLRRRQREIIEAERDGRGGVVAEGRDITTVVAPDADVRILLTADERAWLDAYHAKTREELSPLISDAQTRQWLERATAPFER